MSEERATYPVHGGSRKDSPLLGFSNGNVARPDCAKCGRPYHERTFNTSYFPDDCDGYEPMQSEGDCPEPLCIMYEGHSGLHSMGNKEGDDATNTKDCSCLLIWKSHCPVHAPTLSSERLGGATGQRFDPPGTASGVSPADGGGAEPATPREPALVVTLEQIIASIAETKRLIAEYQAENARLRAKAATWGQL